MGHKTQIMYIEYKGNDGIVGNARIGRVTFSKTGRTLRYQGKEFVTLNGFGFKSNYRDSETEEHYWISGCRKDGRDALYSSIMEIDDDVLEEYWTEIRKMPEMKNVKSVRGISKY